MKNRFLSVHFRFEGIVIFFARYEAEGKEEIRARSLFRRFDFELSRAALDPADEGIRRYVSCYPIRRLFLILVIRAGCDFRAAETTADWHFLIFVLQLIQLVVNPVIGQ